MPKKNLPVSIFCATCHLAGCIVLFSPPKSWCIAVAEPLATKAVFRQVKAIIMTIDIKQAAAVLGSAYVIPYPKLSTC